MFLFVLGRDAVLARAELRAVFPTLVEEFVSDKKIGVSGVTLEQIREVFPKIGGTIKVLSVITACEHPSEWIGKAEAYLTEKGQEGKKVIFGISSDFPKFDRFRAGIDLKKRLKAQEINVRFVNKANLDVATPIVLREKLDDTATELYLTTAGEEIVLAATVAIQDIDAYTRRDMQRERDAKVGMLPPKLAQILLNIAREGDFQKGVWDPFVGLGTVLTEAAFSGATRVVGGDYSEENLASAKANVFSALKKFESPARADFYSGDARTLARPVVEKYKSCVVVSEGYLGSPYANGRVPDTLAEKEKTRVAPIYSEFLASLKAGGFRGTAVICVPAWNLGTRIKNLGLESICKPLGIKIEDISDDTRSYVYRRPDQAVGREIFKLRFA